MSVTNKLRLLQYKVATAITGVFDQQLAIHSMIMLTSYPSTFPSVNSCSELPCIYAPFPIHTPFTTKSACALPKGPKDICPLFITFCTLLILFLVRSKQSFPSEGVPVMQLPSAWSFHVTKIRLYLL